MRYGRSWRDRLAGYYQLMSNPKILDVVESILGLEIFANPVYNVRPKIPRVAAGIVPWHQDKSYWPDAKASPVITVWIPLVDATHENGCLHVMPRTHTRRPLSHHHETYSGTGYRELDDQHVRPRLKEVVALPIQTGGAIIFNDRFIHSSTAHNTDYVRWSVDLRYQPVDQDPMPQHGIGFLARSTWRLWKTGWQAAPSTARIKEIGSKNQRGFADHFGPRNLLRRLVSHQVYHVKE